MVLLKPCREHRSRGLMGGSTRVLLFDGEVAITHRFQFGIMEMPRRLNWMRSRACWTPRVCRMEFNREWNIQFRHRFLQIPIANFISQVARFCYPKTITHNYRINPQLFDPLNYSKTLKFQILFYLLNVRVFVSLIFGLLAFPVM